MGPLVKMLAAFGVVVISVVVMEVTMVIRVIVKEERLEHVQCLETRDH